MTLMSMSNTNNALVLSTIILSNTQKVIQTSAHGCKFSDGTDFNPTEEEKKEMSSYWSWLKVERTFSKRDASKFKEGIGISSSSSRLSDETLAKLRQLSQDNPDAIVLVPFMVIDALWKMGQNVRDSVPNVLAANATAETSRAMPQDKIWDTMNFSY